MLGSTEVVWRERGVMDLIEAYLCLRVGRHWYLRLVNGALLMAIP